MSAEGKAASGAGGVLAQAVRRSSTVERIAVLAAAAVLLVAVFALSFAVSDVSEAVAVLYTLPIALVAIELGAATGALAALLAVGLFGLWAGLDGVGVGAFGFVTRGIGFLLLGWLLGEFSGRLRRAYDTVHRREKQLQAILDNTAAVIYLKDRGGRYMLVNRRFEDLFHVSQEQVAGKTDHDIFPRYLADALRANDRRVLKECCALELEETAPHDDGPHTYLSVKFPLLDQGGEAYGVCGISTDISARKKAEQQLKESKDRVRDILDTAHEAFVAMNAEGDVTAWNKAAEQTFGWPASKAIGRPLADLIVPPCYREAHWLGLAKFLKTGKAPILNRRIELMAAHRDGHEFPVEMTVTPVRVRGGFVFNAFMHDITERKRLEEQTIKLSELEQDENGAGAGDGAVEPTAVVEQSD